MENNKEVGNEGYENFESQGKFISISDDIDKKARKYGKISVMTLIATYAFEGVFYIWAEIYPEVLQYIGERGCELVTKGLLGLQSFFGIASLIFAIIGYKQKDTNLTRGVLIINVFLNLCSFGSAASILFIITWLFSLFR